MLFDKFDNFVCLFIEHCRSFGFLCFNLELPASKQCSPNSLRYWCNTIGTVCKRIERSGKFKATKVRREKVGTRDRKEAGKMFAHSNRWCRILWLQEVVPINCLCLFFISKFLLVNSNLEISIRKVLSVNFYLFSSVPELRWHTGESPVYRMLSVNFR